jgi:hypothetical protein
MDYVLTNIVTGEKYLCNDEKWEYVLKLALDREWEAEGTRLDFYRTLDKLEDELSGFMDLFILVNAHMAWVQWDGRYTDKEGQIVSESDAYNLYLALEGTETDPKMLAFLKAGGFMID